MNIDAGTRLTSATAHGKHGHSLIGETKFRQLYGLALQLQMAGEREESLRGREAALAGVVADLQDGDAAIADFSASLGNILRVPATMSVSRPSFADRVIDALGQALADRMRNTGRITAIFFDPAQSSALLQEARAMAIAGKLPVILVEAGIAKPQRRAAKKKKIREAALEYPSIPVDAHDVIAMYRVAHESIARAREGNGPTHIVGVRWQLPSQNARRRTANPASQDAVLHLEEWLMARGLPAQQWRCEIVAQLAAPKDEQRPAAQNAAAVAIGDEDAQTRAIA